MESTDELAAFENYFTKVISDNKDKTDQLDALRRQLQELEIKESQYEKLDDEFKAELKKAKETSAEMARINSDWTREKQMLNEELGKIQATHNITVKINVHFKSKNDQIKTDINNLNTERKHIEQTLRNKEIKKLTLKTKLAHLRHNLDQIMEQVVIEERDLKRMKQMTNEVQVKMKKHEMEFEEIMNEYEEVQDDVARVTEEIEQYVENNQDEDDGIIDKATISDSLHQDVDYEDDETDLLKQLEELRSENTKTLQEIVQLERELTI